MPDEKSNTVQLGCGTLILIALIVMIFSGRSKVDDLKQSVQELSKQVIMLQGKVDALSRTIEEQQRRTIVLQGKMETQSQAIQKGTNLKSGQQPVEQPLPIKPDSR